jgi:hypothetical protein
MKNSYRDLFAKYEKKKKNLEKHGSGLEDNVKARVKENMTSISAWFPQVQDKLEIQCHIKTVMISGN